MLDARQNLLHHTSKKFDEYCPNYSVNYFRVNPLVCKYGGCSTDPKIMVKRHWPIVKENFPQLQKLPPYVYRYFEEMLESFVVMLQRDESRAVELEAFYAQLGYLVQDDNDSDSEDRC